MRDAPAIFCVDAGGSRCRGRLVDADGAVLAEAEAGPCNPSTDLARAIASLSQVWRHCAAQSGLQAPDVTFAIGGAGLAAQAVRTQFLQGCAGFGRSAVMSDGYAALIGAGGGMPCALIIVGTGVVAHRLYPDGRSIVRDGWGWVGGDRGSGAWLGRKALRHAFASVDGIVAPDALSTAVLARVRGWISEFGGWTVGMGPERLAGLVPLLLESAALGETTANAILSRAADHLAALAQTFQLAPDDSLFIAGGLAGVMRPLLADRLGREVARPDADALTGCFLVARGAAPPEDMIDPLAESDA